jgi:hypothetical protein
LLGGKKDTGGSNVKRRELKSMPVPIVNYALSVFVFLPQISMIENTGKIMLKIPKTANCRI